MKEEQIIEQPKENIEDNNTPLTGIFIFNTILFFALLPLTIFLIIYSLVSGSIIIIGTAFLTNFILTCMTLLKSNNSLYKTISFIYLVVDIFIFIFGVLLLIIFGSIAFSCTGIFGIFG